MPRERWCEVGGIEERVNEGGKGKGGGEGEDPQSWVRPPLVVRAAFRTSVWAPRRVISVSCGRLLFKILVVPLILDVSFPRVTLFLRIIHDLPRHDCRGQRFEFTEKSAYGRGSEGKKDSGNGQGREIKDPQRWARPPLVCANGDTPRVGASFDSGTGHVAGD